MRQWLPLTCLLFGGAVHGQVLINELQCARTAGTDGKGVHGDWVELYNAGTGRVDLGGHILALGMRIARIPVGMEIGPGGHRVLWCDPHGGPESIPLKLPRDGGTLLLVAPDGERVLDLFRWPALPPGVSMGRATDGSRDWGFAPEPTPGMANGSILGRLLPMPAFAERNGLLAISGPDHAEIRYTTDGTEAGPDAERYTGPLSLPPGLVVRARAYAADAVSSREAVWTPALADSCWALVIAPQDWQGPDGIADTANGNHARKGKAWQRQAWVQHDGKLFPVGMAIAGSGSRSLPKRNFKLSVRDRFQGTSPVCLPDGTPWRHVTLRADASPNAFLRNAFIGEMVRRSGDRLEVQPASAVPLYLNGDFQGLYRAMPAKGAEWLRSLNEGAPVEIVEGPAAVAVKGSAKGYLKALEALKRGIAIDSLDRLMDVESLVELACFDLWTGRADHEMNVRAWRPMQPGGRWRWVLYDMDLWAPPADRTVQRMTGAMVPEAPFLRAILDHPALGERLLARMAALCATTFSPDQALPVADSLYARNRRLMELDHRRWRDQMPMVSPGDGIAALRDHITGRAGPLLRQLAEQGRHRLHTLTVQVEPAGAGRVAVEELALTGRRKTMEVFDGVPLHVHAIAREGMEFAGWKGMEDASAELVLEPRSDRQLVAVFRPSGLSGQGPLQQRLEQQTPVGIAQ